MKSYCILIIGLLSTFAGFAQVNKIYLDAKGVYTNKPKKSVAYFLIEKLADSAYVVQKYNMHDTLIMRGTFKDDLMKIPNGKFVYYTKKQIPENLLGILHTDTNNFISCVGYFANGVKTGMWIEYEKVGVKRRTYFYQNGKMNGLLQLYDPNVKDYIIEEGYIVNDKKEGEWNVYGYDTVKTPVLTKIFKDDKIIKTITHIQKADFSLKLQGYLKNQLSSQRDSLLLRYINTKITVDTDGSVKDVVVLSTVSPKIGALIIKTLTNAPKFIPELHDNKPIKMRYFFDFVFGEKGIYARGYGDFAMTLSHDVGNGLEFGTTELP